jgi:hypothetical protein
MLANEFTNRNSSVNESFVQVSRFAKVNSKCRHKSCFGAQFEIDAKCSRLENFARDPFCIFSGDSEISRAGGEEKLEG